MKKTIISSSIISSLSLAALLIAGGMLLSGCNAMPIKKDEVACAVPASKNLTQAFSESASTLVHKWRPSSFAGEAIKV